MRTGEAVGRLRRERASLSLLRKERLFHALHVDELQSMPLEAKDGKAHGQVSCRSSCTALNEGGFVGGNKASL